MRPRNGARGGCRPGSTVRARQHRAPTRPVGSAAARCPEVRRCGPVRGCVGGRGVWVRGRGAAGPRPRPARRECFGAGWWAADKSCLVRVTWLGGDRASGRGPPTCYSFSAPWWPGRHPDVEQRRAPGTVRRRPARWRGRFRADPGLTLPGERLAAPLPPGRASGRRPLLGGAGSCAQPGDGLRSGGERRPAGPGDAFGVAGLLGGWFFAVGRAVRVAPAGGRFGVWGLSLGRRPRP